MGETLGMFLLGIFLYACGLTSTRASLKDELTYITHKRVFRHKPKRKIPFFRRFFLLNYVNQFKKKWMWHYVVFIAEAIAGLLAIALHILRVIFEDSALVAGLHRALLLLCAVLFMLPMFFPDTRRMRRKK